jgi:hypothetical protein
MRCNAFHPFDCMAVNARNGHVVVKSISLNRGRPGSQAKPTVIKRDASGCEPR